MNATEIYNPFLSIWTFTQKYFEIIAYELSNDNAKAFYAQGWQSNNHAINLLKEEVLEGWENHAQCCIAVFVPSFLCAIATYRMWQNRKAPLLPVPYQPKRPIALLPPDQPILDTSWIDWKAYLELLLKHGRLD